MNTVSIIGLGKLGSCMAATMAMKGNHVIGIDTNESCVATVNQGKAPVIEPGLQDLFSVHKSRITATSNFDAVEKSSITFIIVPTPSDERGGFSNRFVSQTIKEIGRVLARKKDYHLVVLTSTVLPGTSQSELIPELERISGKKCGRDFGFCYNPEFIALGDVINGLLKPDMVLIGESDDRAGGLLKNWYGGFCENNPTIVRAKLVNAELAKISVNTYVTMKITFANMLLDICDHLPGADVDEVTRAIGLDSRIGKRYLTGALGYGGPCFPRDNKALAYFANQCGANAGLPLATDAVNQTLATRLAEKIQSLLERGKKVGVLGAAYKPDTNVVEESQGILLAQSLLKKGYRVSLFDPLALENAKKALGTAVEYAGSLKDSLADSDLIAITIPCREFKSLGENDFPKRSQPVIVLDCWRILRQSLETSGRIRYVPLGVGTPKSGAIGQ